MHIQHALFLLQHVLNIPFFLSEKRPTTWHFFLAICICRFFL